MLQQRKQNKLCFDTVMSCTLFFDLVSVLAKQQHKWRLDVTAKKWKIMLLCNAVMCSWDLIHGIQQYGGIDLPCLGASPTIRLYLYKLITFKNFAKSRWKLQLTLLIKCQMVLTNQIKPSCAGVPVWQGQYLSSSMRELSDSRLFEILGLGYFQIFSLIWKRKLYYSERVGR